MLMVMVILLSLGKISAMDSPVFGILAQEPYIVQKYLPDKYKCFIAASYVKFIEGAGARVVPIRIGEDNRYYKRILNYTNGVLFPGGGVYFNETGGYGEAAQEIYKIALNINEQGTYYPIWGTCLGMQALAYAAKGTDIRIDCMFRKVATPLNFVKDYKRSRLFSEAPEDIIDILQTKNVTYNYHKYCLTYSVLKKNGLLSDWRILSTNHDDSNIEFISAMEHKKYPFYGVQFHPEKNVFEFKENMGIPHDFDAIRATQYFANFLVNEGRKNDQRWPNFVEENRELIYNYNPIFTGSKNSSYEQIYVFN